MCRVQCMSALLALCVGLAQSFSWDIAVARANRIEFYNYGRLTHSAITTSNSHIIKSISYDPVHNRVLIADDYNKDDSVYSFDIATRKILSLFKKPSRIIWDFVYDPVTELFFGTILRTMYSFSIKPGSNTEGDIMFSLENDHFREIAVDGCKGYIYWTSYNRSNVIERARFDGSEKEVLIDSSSIRRKGLTFDQETQKIYWTEIKFTSQSGYADLSIESADFNGRNRRRLYIEKQPLSYPVTLAVSKYFISWIDRSQAFYWQIPKNPSRYSNVRTNKIPMTASFPYGAETFSRGAKDIVANYKMNEHTLQNCQEIATLLPNHSETNDGTKVGEESRCEEEECTQACTGGSCDVSVCQNYCLHGDCSTSLTGKPICRCSTGYSGDRCELNACYKYCWNDGICSLNEDTKPVCQCSGHYEGERCEVPIFLMKCLQTVSMFKGILNSDATSDALDRKLQATCA